MLISSTITLSKVEQMELTQRAASQAGRADEARRVRLILLLGAGHTSAEFVTFLTDIVAHRLHGKEIHVIADNLSARKSPPVKAFLDAHPKVYLHFTPTYSS